ncbi:carbamoyltransferase C-terminal domain-containing protein [Streptomyces sp. NPDC048331]|uniref:carbamoyltransferase C-terminal domain-containing protein n=1 Tax=Streptomyces sp. NPDC048331 TaxID=3365534 RepID=UPI00371F5482
MAVALGLNFHHDTSTALVVDGRLYAAEEERWSGLKHNRRHGELKGVLTAPTESLTWCLDAAGIDPHEVDAVWAAAMRPSPSSGQWLATEHDELAALLPDPLGRKLRLVSHHTAHVLAGYLMSDLDHAAGLVIDAGGSPLGFEYGPGRERITGYDLRHGKIDRIHQALPTLAAGRDGIERIHHSLGHFYRNMAHRVIPPGDEPEGSMMALAAYGDPDRFRSAMSHMIGLGEDGEVHVLAPYGSADAANPLHAGGYEWTTANAAVIPLSVRADFAAAAQEAFAGAVVHVARHLHQLTGAKHLVFSGGCALNSALNGSLAEQSGFDHVFVAPAPHDAGTAVGAALYGWHHQLQQDPLGQPTDASWGPEPDGAGMGLLPADWHPVPRLGNSVAPAVAGLLADGYVVGWVQGAMEFGPRALGHRSILAHPGRRDTRDTINQLKRRADYRPFAPAVLARYASQWFAGEGDPFMNRVVRVLPHQADRVPAIVHRDGTARAQVVHPGHSGLEEILEQFRLRTGLPMLLNTSFNLKGTPILRTAAQAVEAAASLGLDALAVGDSLFVPDRLSHGRPPLEMSA